MFVTLLWKWPLLTGMFDGGKSEVHLKKKEKPCSKYQCSGVGVTRRYLNNSTTTIEVELILQSVGFMT